MYWALNSLVAYGLKRWERHASRYLVIPKSPTKPPALPIDDMAGR